MRFKTMDFKIRRQNRIKKYFVNLGATLSVPLW
jgi:hypothetical protein